MGRRAAGSATTTTTWATEGETRHAQPLPAPIAGNLGHSGCCVPARRLHHPGPAAARLSGAAAGHGRRPITLQVEILDSSGQRFPANNAARMQYLQLAESAFTRAGWILAPDAPLTARILLLGRLPEGLVASEASLGRNLATGLLTLNTACKEWTHRVDAAGTITVLDGESVLAEQAIDLAGTETSCFSMMNPSWLANHQQAALDTYQQAAATAPTQTS